MVSTRRKTAVDAGEPSKSAPQASPRPLTSRRRSPTKTQTFNQAVTSAADRAVANKYREQLRREREYNNKTIIHRIFSQLRVYWHRFRIALAGYMLDKWEETLYILGLLLLVFGVLHALMRYCGPFLPTVDVKNGNGSSSMADNLSGFIKKYLQ